MARPRVTEQGSKNAMRSMARNWIEIGACQADKQQEGESCNSNIRRGVYSLILD
jgi:hypothetical protein